MLVLEGLSCLPTGGGASSASGFPEVYVGPERFKKVREACRNNFHLISCNMVSVVTSYDQKPKKVNDKKSNDYFNMSVFFPGPESFLGPEEFRKVREAGW